MSRSDEPPAGPTSPAPKRGLREPQKSAEQGRSKQDFMQWVSDAHTALGADDAAAQEMRELMADSQASSDWINRTFPPAEDFPAPDSNAKAAGAEYQSVAAAQQTRDAAVSSRRPGTIQLRLEADGEWGCYMVELAPSGLIVKVHRPAITAREFEEVYGALM